MSRVSFIPVCFLALAASAENGKIPVTTSSEEARALFLQGRDLVEKLRGTDALPFFDKAVAKDPQFATAYLNLANTAPTGTEFFAALEKAVATAPKASEGERLQILATQAAVKSEPQAQRELLEKLVALYPDDERAHAALGLFYFVQQDWGAAIKSLERSTAIAPDFSVPYNQLGYAYRFEEKYDDAEKAFRKYIELLPQDPNPYDSYAELLMKRGRFAESIASYRKALEVDPNFIASYIGIALDQVLLGRSGEARKTLSQLSAKARNDGEKRQALFWTAMTLVHEGKLDEAVKSVVQESAIARKSGDLGALAGDHVVIGNILLAAGKGDEAAAKFKAAVKLNAQAKVPPEVKEAARRNSLYNLGRADIVRGDLASAEKKAAEYSKLVEAKRVPFEVWQSHELAGRIALEKKDYDTAAVELDKGNSQDPRVFFLRALALKGKGDQAGALASARKAVEYNSINNANYAYVRKDAQRFVDSEQKG
jgi:tetratricopeptide (TPR) repeat protein